MRNALPFLALIILACIPPTVPDNHEEPQISTQIEEDSPLWDCHTMGNLICGPTK